MRLFNIIDRFDEKIKLYNIGNNIVKIWKINDKMIGLLARNNMLGFNCGYVIMPVELYTEIDEDILLGELTNEITLNEQEIEYYGLDAFGGEWFVGFDYGNAQYWHWNGTHSKSYFDEEPLNVQVEHVEELANVLSKHIQI